MAYPVNFFFNFWRHSTDVEATFHTDSEVEDPFCVPFSGSVSNLFFSDNLFSLGVV